MGKIHVMSHNLANKIAAGEVIERPSSVVKELVENAIDAKATKIDIFLENAGITSIKVIDNGTGMDKDDARLAFSRHATSKLLSEQDLFRIMTLGFRGEALPSIASVSDVTLSTYNGEGHGTMIHYRGGKLIEESVAPNRIGTEVQVKSLFFNTPARLKYLKSENTELSYTTDFINKIAISNPHIAFKLVNNNRVLLETYGNNDIINILGLIYGFDVAKKTSLIDYQDEQVKLQIYLSMPDINRTTRNYMTIIVNKRAIKNYELTKAILDGYDTYLPMKRYPIVVVEINVDPLLVDVNVHPAKLEVRLSNQTHIKTVITDLIQKKLRDSLYVPKVNIREQKITEVKEVQESFDFTNFEPIVVEKKQEEKIYQERPLIKEEKVEEIENKVEKKLPQLYYIGQLKGTYLLAQNEEGLYLIDQHAAEERINYEFYLKHFSQTINEYYELLIPLTFEFSLNEALIIEENLHLLKDMKIEIEKFGLNSFIVNKIPNFFNRGSEKEILDVIFTYLINQKKIDNKILFNDLAKEISCKRSIRANQYINNDEISTLIKRLEQCENPFTCPHGRPVIVQITFNEIERLFKRIM